MRDEGVVVAPQTTGVVPVVEHEVVRKIRAPPKAGWRAKRIAKEPGAARNTVRRYLRCGECALPQARPEARVLDEAQQAKAVQLWEGPAEENAAVVRKLLEAERVKTRLRTVQHALARPGHALRVGDLFP